MSTQGLHKQIYGNLNLKETDELLKIWQTNNHYEWSDEAFEILKEILQERDVEIPEQDEPVFEPDERSFDNDGLDEWEAKALENENQPEFYDALEVINLKNTINKVAKAAILIYALQSIPMFEFFRQLVASYFYTQSTFMPLIYLISLVFVVLSAAVSIAIVYFPLQALAHILRILMEMEFRSRKAN